MIAKLAGTLLALLLLSPSDSVSQPGPARASTDANQQVVSADPELAVASDSFGPTAALDLAAASDLDAIIPRLATRDVVFVSESHDRLDHHLNQLAIIQRLHPIHPDLVIGLEVFERGHQEHLDAYVAGKISEREMLKKTEYYVRTNDDFRLYAPILRFARERRIPLLGLNLPRTMVRKVGRAGLDSLTAEERARLPAEIDRTVPGYRERLEEVFEEHPKIEGMNFERFVEAQLLWDEGMAERAAEYLQNRSAEHMVVLAGAEHLAYGRGIPIRLKRRIDVDTAIVLNGTQADMQRGVADFVLLTQEVDLPSRGRLGVELEPEDEGVKVTHLSLAGAAADAGIQEEDWIVAIDGVPIKDLADLRVEMWDRRPGERVALRVRREQSAAVEEVLDFEIELR